MRPRGGAGQQQACHGPGRPPIKAVSWAFLPALFGGAPGDAQDGLSVVAFFAIAVVAAMAGIILTAITANRALTRKVKSTIRDLSESEAKYRQLIENSGDGMFVAGLDGTLTYVNRPLAAMLGRDAGQLVGTRLFEIVDPGCHEEVAAALACDGVSGDSQMFDAELCTAGGDSVYCQVNTSVVLKEDEPVAIQGVVRDMTARRRLEEELRRQTEEARRVAAEMKSVYQVGVATTSILDLGALLAAMYEQVVAMMGNESFYVALFDQEASEIRFEFVVDNGVRQEAFVRPFPTGKGITEWVIKTGQPVFIRDSATDMDSVPVQAIMVGEKPLSVIAVPLSVQNRVVGVMSIQSYVRRFDPGDLRVISTIGTQAAIAIENARMVDIDDFKQYNDLLGHPAGDVALKAVATLITRSVRSTDIVARYGGEEFVVILLEAEKAQATRVAEKIRARIEAYPFPHEEELPCGRVTVTVGVATYPDDARNKKDLVYLADMACYRGKREGRNRVVGA